MRLARPGDMITSAGYGGGAMIGLVVGVNKNPVNKNDRGNYMMTIVWTTDDGSLIINDVMTHKVSEPGGEHGDDFWALLSGVNGEDR